MSESILNENLIATFEQSLRQTRNAQNRLMVRLREVETEGDRLRQEIEALDSSAEKTEAAIYSILATMGSKNKRNQNDRNDDNRNEDNRNDNNRNDSNRNSGMRKEGFDSPADAWRDDQYNSERDDYRRKNRRDDYSSNDNFRDEPISVFSNDRNGLYRNTGNVRESGNNRNNGNNNNHRRNNNNRSVPQVGHNIEPISQRFSDRTITQACTLLLRESGSPLHVNELYNYLVAGGFEFKGNNPTISIAVSLNRNRRFKKVAPGTFDLIMRDASQAAS